MPSAAPGPPPDAPLAELPAGEPRCMSVGSVLSCFCDLALCSGATQKSELALLLSATEATYPPYMRHSSAAAAAAAAAAAEAQMLLTDLSQVFLMIFGLPPSKVRPLLLPVLPPREAEAKATPTPLPL